MATCSIIPTSKSWIEVIYQSYKYLLAARKLNLFLSCFFLGNNLAGLNIFFCLNRTVVIKLSYFSRNIPLIDSVG